MEKLKRLLRITIVAVCSVLAVTCFGFYYIEVKSDHDVERKEIATIAERQQIICQKILKNVLLAMGDRRFNTVATQSALRDLLSSFQKQHQLLINLKNEHLASPGDLQRLLAIANSATPAHQNIIKAANTALVSNGIIPNQNFLREISLSETVFIEKMDRFTHIIFANQQRIDQQVLMLNMFILGVLIVAIAVLGLLVISPMFKQAISDYRALSGAVDSVEAANMALAVNEEKYRYLFSSNPLPMWVFDLETFKFLDVNAIACSHYGYSREEFLSMTVLDIRNEEHQQAFINAAHPINLPLQNYERGTWHHRKKNGTEIEVEIFAHNTTFNGGNARMVVVNDVTKRRVAEEKLKQNEANLEQAQQMAHFGHWTLDFATGKSIWSAEACRIYGLDITDNEHSHQSWLSFIHPEDVDAVVALTTVAQQTASRSEFYHRIVLRDNTIKHLFSQSSYQLDHTGKPIGMYGVAHDVTEQKLAEEKILNSNRLYNVISNINQLIVHAEHESMLLPEACRIATEIGDFDLGWISKLDRDKKVLNLVTHCQANPQDLEHITTIAYEEDGPVMQVMTTGAHFHVNDTSKSPPATKIAAYIASRGFKSFIFLPIKKSGNIYATLNLFSYKTDLFDHQELMLLEEVTGDLSFALDVFERKEQGEMAEKRLAHSELRLRQAQSIAQVGSWEINFERGLSIWSDEHCRIYGLEPTNNKHSFESWLSFIHPDDVGFVKAAIEGDGIAYRDASIEHRIIRPDGSVAHIYMHSQYELDEQGRPIGLYGVAHDVTQSRMAERSLVQSEANLRMIMDLLPQRIFVKDLSGKFLFVNQSFAELYGMSPKEMVAASRAGALVALAGEEAFMQDDREVILGGKKKIVPEETFLGPLGEQKIFHVTKLPYFFGRRHQQSVLGILNEITEQKRAESERNSLLKDIVRRNESLEQFAYIISHNLRAPVANILALSALLNSADEPNQETRTLLVNLNISTNKLDSVIQDLNKILKSTHHSTGKKEKVAFAEICEDVKLSLADHFVNGEVEVFTDFKHIDGLLSVKGYLYSIFYNLISNSIKYRKPNEHVRIRISSAQLNGKVQLDFTDNGLGMDLANVGEDLFGLYKRFHNHVDGKGMGLYMVKRHVEIMGGEISVSSIVNEGTTFKIILKGGNG